MEDALYKVTLVVEDKEYVGVHASKTEAALAALAAHTAERSLQLWEQGQLSALPMLQTFDSYEAVVEYMQEIHEASAKWEVRYFGPYDRGELPANPGLVCQVCGQGFDFHNGCD